MFIPFFLVRVYSHTRLENTGQGRYFLAKHRPFDHGVIMILYVSTHNGIHINYCLSYMWNTILFNINFQLDNFFDYMNKAVTITFCSRIIFLI